MNCAWAMSQVPGFARQRRPNAKLAGSVVFLTAMLSHAAVPDPFPNQPGALSAGEIEAAIQAKNLAGRGPALPLVASGKRSPAGSMPAYVLFAAPFEKYSDRVRTRKQIVCNFLAEAWRCSEPVDEFRMPANGIQHVFSYQVVRGRGNRQDAVDVAEFMYSGCFNTQFAAIGGKPFTPSPDSDYVSTVMDDGAGFNVATGPLGDGDSYRLEKTDKAVDNCGFRLRHARSAKSGALLPESYAKEQEKAPQEDQARVRGEQAERGEQLRAAAAAPVGQPISDSRRLFGELTDIAVALNVLFGLAALLGPFAALTRSTKSAAGAAALLTSATVIMAVAAVAFYKLAAIADTGNFMLIVAPVTLLAGLSCLIWVIAWTLKRR